MDPIKNGDRVVIKRNIRQDISDGLNVIIVCLAGAGVYRLLKHMDDENVLVSSGFANLKYYTSISNILCLATAILFLVLSVINKRCPILPKLISVSGIGLTFLVTAVFLAPSHPDLNLYVGANRFFHLWVPIAAMIEFVMFEQDRRMPFKYTLYTVIPTLLYGLAYLINCLVNGIKTETGTNDWYGFLEWGYPTGILIFAVVIILNWAIACLLWFIKSKIK